MLKVRSAQDLLSGLTFILFGLAGLWFGAEYTTGTALRMGPGYMPMLLSWGLLLVGAVVLRRGFALEAGPIGRIGWRPIFIVLGGVVLFAALIDRVGLAVTTAVVAFVVTYASSEPWLLLRRLALAAALSAFSVGLFVYALRQAIPPWWWD